MGSTKWVELSSQGDCALWLYLYVTVNILPVSVRKLHTQSIVISIGFTHLEGGVRDGAVVWGTTLQTGRSRFRLPMVSSLAMILGSTQPLTEVSTGDISWGLRRRVRRADNLTTFMCRLSWNAGNLNFMEPWGPVWALYRGSFTFTYWKVRNWSRDRLEERVFA